MVFLVKVSIAVVKHHGQKRSWGGKVLSGLCSNISVYHQRKSGLEFKQSRNLEAGSGGVLLTDLFSMVCST